MTLHIAIDNPTRIPFSAILPDQTSASAQRFFHMAEAGDEEVTEAA